VFGKTLGYSKRNCSYWENGQPKLLLARPLIADAVSYLASPFLPVFHKHRKEDQWMIDVYWLPLQSEGGLMELLKTLIDPRKPRGVHYPVVTIVAIAICAALSGARSYIAVAEWPKTLISETLVKLGSKRPTPPSEPTIRRVLQKLDAAVLDSQISA
jgi:hypothetical protein